MPAHACRLSHRGTLPAAVGGRRFDHRKDSSPGVEEDILTRLARCQLLDRCGAVRCPRRRSGPGAEAARTFQPRAILIDWAPLTTADGLRSPS